MVENNGGPVQGRRTFLGRLGAALPLVLVPATLAAVPSQLEREVVALLREGRRKDAMLRILGTMEADPAVWTPDPGHEGRMDVLRLMREGDYEEAIASVVRAWRASRPALPSKEEAGAMAVGCLRSMSGTFMEIKNAAT